MSRISAEERGRTGGVAAAIVAVVVALGWMLKQEQPSEILAMANAARSGRTSVRFSSRSKIGSASSMGWFLFAFMRQTPSCPGLTVTVDVDVATVLPSESLISYCTLNYGSNCCKHTLH